MNFPPWLARALLAVMLAFGSEIVLWTNPTGRSLLDWLILALGYIVLSAVLLDLAVRYRVRDLFSLMALAGVYGLAVGLLLNPQTALVDVPRTLITRVMGAHTLIGLAMLAFFLKAGNLRRVGLIIIGAAGLGWGVWVRWLPTLTDSIVTETSLIAMVVYAVVGLLLILVAMLLEQRFASGLPPIQLRLSLPGWIVAAVALGAVLVIRLSAENIDALSLVIILVLIAFCIVLLWFQKREKGAMLLDHRASGDVPVFAILLFLGAGIVGYSLPFKSGGEQLALVVGLFTAFGLVWLPTISLVMGVRAYRKLTRTGRL